MAQFRKKPVVVEAITWDEFIAIGREQYRILAKPLDLHDMPWSFTYGGWHVTHETDMTYLIPTPEGVMQFHPGEMLITGVEGEIYPCKGSIFLATYEPRDPFNAEVFEVK